MVLGERVKMLREEQGLRREDLASRSGLAYQSIVMIEQGRRPDPRGSTLAALARAFAVTVDFLLGRTDRRT